MIKISIKLRLLSLQLSKLTKVFATSVEIIFLNCCKRLLYDVIVEKEK